MPITSVVVICTRCGAAFQYLQHGCHRRSFCDACKMAAHRSAMEKVNSTDANKMAKLEYSRSPRGKEKKAQYNATPAARAQHKAYKKSPEGKLSQRRHWKSQAFLDTRRRYLQSDKGKANLARMRIIWRGGDSHAEYLSYKQEAFRDSLPCVKCGKPWVDGTRGATHEIDHIIPRKLGGTHNRDNLQVLCFQCHLAKTRTDKERMKCLCR